MYSQFQKEICNLEKFGETEPHKDWGKNERHNWQIVIIKRSIYNTVDDILVTFGTLDETFEKSDEDILDNIEDEEGILEESETEALQNFVWKRMIGIKQIETNNSKSPESNFPVSSSSKRKMLWVKLPKLKIKKFSKDPKMYCAFRANAFKLVGNKNNEVSAAEKFTYFKSYLARDYKSGLALTSRNHKVALKLIEKRFSSIQVIIDSQIKFLYKLPLIRNIENMKNMQECYSKMEMNFRS